jgi:hypothetical protein
VTTPFTAQGAHIRKVEEPREFDERSSSKERFGKQTALEVLGAYEFIWSQDES